MVGPNGQRGVAGAVFLALICFSTFVSPLLQARAQHAKEQQIQARIDATRTCDVVFYSTQLSNEEKQVLADANRCYELPSKFADERLVATLREQAKEKLDEGNI
jgi:outer membrane lipoprotein-sorting protein